MPYWQHRDTIQAYLREQSWRGWLLMDFRGSNPLFEQVLGRGPSGGHLTRRTFCWIPTERGAATGNASPTEPGAATGAGNPANRPVVLAHAIESGALRDDRWDLRTYHDGASLRAALESFGLAGGTVA